MIVQLVHVIMFSGYAHPIVAHVHAAIAGAHVRCATDSPDWLFKHSGG